MSSSVGLRAAGTLDILSGEKKLMRKRTSKLLRVRRGKGRDGVVASVDSDQRCFASPGCSPLSPTNEANSSRKRLALCCLAFRENRIFEMSRSAALFLLPNADRPNLPQSISPISFGIINNRAITATRLHTFLRETTNTHTHTKSSVRLDPCGKQEAACNAV